MHDAHSWIVGNGRRGEGTDVVSKAPRYLVHECRKYKRKRTGERTVARCDDLEHRPEDIRGTLFRVDALMGRGVLVGRARPAVSEGDGKSVLRRHSSGRQRREEASQGMESEDSVPGAQAKNIAPIRRLRFLTELTIRSKSSPPEHSSITR